MARLRVFVSSTYFDLRQVRNDLEHFIKDMGYEPVLNERGQIPYGSDRRLEEYCYTEIPLVDILVSIVGSRFGSPSQHAPDSISQMEIKTALELGKQVYVFIDKNVYAEFQIYKDNKENGTIKWKFASDVRIHNFIEFLEGLPQNNAIQPFESADDIIGFLREQWAGLFQRYLQDAIRQKERREIQDLQATARSLKDLVTLLGEQVKWLNDEKKGQSELLRGHAESLRDVLLSSHPAMARLREIAGVKYRVYFTTLNELADWLQARQFTRQPDGLGTHDWTYTRDKKEFRLYVDSDIFDDEGRLRVISESEWKDDFIVFKQVVPEPSPVKGRAVPRLTAPAAASAARVAAAASDEQGGYGGASDDDIPF